MPSPETSKPQERPLAELAEIQRDRAMVRFAVLQPHLERGTPLAQAARAAGVALRTAERCLSRYRAAGLIGLARMPALMAVGPSSPKSSSVSSKASL
jgi:leucine-zipper of insertion element IS481